MPTTNARKHAIPAGADQNINRATIFETFGNSIRDIVPVASVTERSQLVTALSNKGEAPSATKPLVVYRLDAPGLHRLESTTDGNNWISASGALSFANKAAADSFGTSSGGLLSVGDEARVGGVEYRWSGSAWYLPHTGGRGSAATDGSGIVRITHGVGKTPLSVTASVGMDTPVIPESLKLEVGNITATTFDVRFRRADQGNANFTGNPVVFYWTAVA